MDSYNRKVKKHDHRDAPFAICHIYIVTNTQDSVWEGLEIGLY